MAKIPPHATCVFRGEIFDIYQWQQEMFDGSTETFEVAKRPTTVSVIPVMDGQVLYNRQEQPFRKPFLSFYGGRGEPNEDPLETAKRELLEEAGVVSDDWELLLEETFSSKLDWTIYHYIARACRKVAEPNLDAGEKIEGLSCAPEQLLEKVILQPDFSEFGIKKYLFDALNQDKLQQLIARLKA